MEILLYLVNRKTNAANPQEIWPRGRYQMCLEICQYVVGVDYNPDRFDFVGIFGPILYWVFDQWSPNAPSNDTARWASPLCDGLAA